MSPPRRAITEPLTDAEYDYIENQQLQPLLLNWPEAIYYAVIDTVPLVAAVVVQKVNTFIDNARHRPKRTSATVFTSVIAVFLVTNLWTFYHAPASLLLRDLGTVNFDTFDFSNPVCPPTWVYPDPIQRLGFPPTLYVEIFPSNSQIEAAKEWITACWHPDVTLDRSQDPLLAELGVENLLDAGKKIWARYEEAFTKLQAPSAGMPRRRQQDVNHQSTLSTTPLVSSKSWLHGVWAEDSLPHLAPDCQCLPEWRVVKQAAITPWFAQPERFPQNDIDYPPTYCPCSGKRMWKNWMNTNKRLLPPQSSHRFWHHWTSWDMQPACKLSSYQGLYAPGIDDLVDESDQPLPLHQTKRSFACSWDPLSLYLWAWGNRFWLGSHARTFASLRRDDRDRLWEDGWFDEKTEPTIVATRWYRNLMAKKERAHEEELRMREEERKEQVRLEEERLAAEKQEALQLEKERAQREEEDSRRIQKEEERIQWKNEEQERMENLERLRQKKRATWSCWALGWAFHQWACEVPDEVLDNIAVSNSDVNGVDKGGNEGGREMRQDSEKQRQEKGMWSCWTLKKVVQAMRRPKLGLALYQWACELPDKNCSDESEESGLDDNGNRECYYKTYLLADEDTDLHDEDTTLPHEGIELADEHEPKATKAEVYPITTQEIEFPSSISSSSHLASGISLSSLSSSPAPKESSPKSTSTSGPQSRVKSNKSKTKLKKSTPKSKKNEGASAKKTHKCVKRDASGQGYVIPPECVESI